MLTTSLTPGTRSFMIRSMPALRVCVDAGQLTQAPCSSTVMTPASSSTSTSRMSPLSAWIAGRMIAMTSSTPRPIDSGVLSLYGDAHVAPGGCVASAE
jgi:hypothetical protein